MSSPRPNGPGWTGAWGDPRSWADPRAWSTAWPGGQELRIGDADRDAAVSALGEHFAAGRLTREEYDERAEQANAAKTASGLRPLFADLPAPHPVLGGSGRPRPTSYRQDRQAVPAPTKPRFRLPFVPVLLVLVGLAILFDAGWIVFLGLGLLWLTRSARFGCGGTARHHRT